LQQQRAEFAEPFQGLKTFMNSFRTALSSEGVSSTFPRRIMGAVERQKTMQLDVKDESGRDLLISGLNYTGLGHSVKS